MHERPSIQYIPIVHYIPQIFQCYGLGCIFSQNMEFLPHPFFSKMIFFPQLQWKFSLSPVFSTSSPLYLRCFLLNHHMFSPAIQYFIILSWLWIQNILNWMQSRIHNLKKQIWLRLFREKLNMRFSDVFCCYSAQFSADPGSQKVPFRIGNYKIQLKITFYFFILYKYFIFFVREVIA